MRSAFGVEHGEIAKSYGKIAGRLARAAEGGSEYAQARIKAGSRGAGVGQNIRTAQAPVPKGMQNRGKARKQRQAAKSATIGAQSGKFSGNDQAQRAKSFVGGKTPGGIGRMENQAAEKISFNRTRKRVKRGLIGAGIGVGAGAGGGYAYGRSRNG